MSMRRLSFAKDKKKVGNESETKFKLNTAACGVLG